MSPKLGSPAQPVLRLLTSDDDDHRRAPGRPRPPHQEPLEPRLPLAFRGGYLRRLLAPRRPIERALLSVIQETYLIGASTRTIDAIAESIGVPGSEPAMVAEEGLRWDQRVEAFQRRRLDDVYPYLMLTQTPVLVREDGQVQPFSVIVAVGKAEPGGGDIVGLGACPTDRLENFWGWFLVDLRDRGLQSLELVTSADHKGLLPALAKLFPNARWQRCREQFMAEALRSVPRSARRPVANSLRAVFAQSDATAALRRLDDVRGRFEFAFPELVAHLSQPVGALLAYYQAPGAVRLRLCSLRSLAVMERELRRSCQLVGIFPHRRALLRLTGTILQERSEEWAARIKRRRRRPATAAAWATGATESAAAEWALAPVA